MSKLKIFLIVLTTISIITFIGSVVFFIIPDSSNQINDISQSIIRGELNPDIDIISISNGSYKDLIGINNETHIFDKSISKYNNLLVISDRYATTTYLPEPSKNNQLNIEIQIEDLNSGKNISLLGTALIPKGYIGHFEFNTSLNDFIIFKDKSKFNFTWQFATKYSEIEVIKLTENKTDVINNTVIEKQYIDYKDLTIKPVLSGEAFLDPDVTACGYINSPGVYTLVNNIINYPAHCIYINSSNVEFKCNAGTVIDGDSGYGDMGITSWTSNASNYFTNITIHDCVLTNWDVGIRMQYVNSSNISNIQMRDLRASSGLGFYGNFFKYSIINNFSIMSLGDSGMTFSSSTNNNITNGAINGTTNGLIWGYAGTSTIFSNMVITNVQIGIKTTHSGADNYLIYNSFINVTQNYTSQTAGADNYYNSTNATETNIVGGSIIGGNFWANSTGGYSENCVDTDNNGICDVRFNVTSRLACPSCTGYNIDYLPLAKAPSEDLYPTFENIVTNPINNSYYSPNVYYKFNSTIVNTNGTAGIGFDGVNYTATNISSIFNTSIFNLGAGTYSYYWWAYGNGVSHLFNTTILYDYVVNKTTPTEMIVTMNPSTSIPYGTAMSITGENCPSQLSCNLYNNNISVSNPDSTLLGVNYYQYIFNTSGNANYTSYTTSDVLTITQIESVTALTFNATSPQIYPTTIIPNCTLITGQGIPNLTIDGRIITSGDAIKLGVGTHAFNCSIDNTQNYTGSSDSFNYIINQGTPPLTLEILPGINVVQGTETNVTGFGCPTELKLVADSNCTLYRNNVTVNNSDVQTLAIGSYQYIFNTSGNLNYTYYSVEGLLVVNESFDLDYPLFSDYWDDNATIEVNGTAYFNVTVLKTNGTVFLHINGSKVVATNSTTDVYNASVYLTIGTYIYNWSSYGNGSGTRLNYSSQRNYTVIPDITSPTANLISPINNTYNSTTTQNFTANFSDAHGLKNATLYIFNSMGIYNITTRNLGGTNEEEIGITVSNLADNMYNWSYRVFDNTGNSFTTSNWTITIDTIYPLISYGTGTQSSGVNLSQNWIYINTSWTEVNFANITFSLFNDTDVVNSTIFTTPIYKINWTNLQSENYSYQVNITDLLNYNNATEVRFITLDFLAPNATLLSPTNGSLNTTTIQNFTANVSDNDGLFNATLYIYNQTGIYNVSTTNITGKTGIIGWITTLMDGIYTWFVEVFDSTGNYFRTGNFTVTIDTTPPYFTSFPNKSQYDDEAITYTIGASDAMTSINCFKVNATYNFSITCGGVLTSSVGMQLGYHYINITVNDTLNNKISGVMWVNVLNYSDVPIEPFTWYNDSETLNNRLFAISEGGDVILEKNGSIQRRRVATKIWIGETGNSYVFFNESV